MKILTTLPLLPRPDPRQPDPAPSRPAQPARPARGRRGPPPPPHTRYEPSSRRPKRAPLAAMAADGRPSGWLQRTWSSWRGGIHRLCRPHVAVKAATAHPAAVNRCQRWRWCRRAACRRRPASRRGWPTTALRRCRDRRLVAASRPATPSAEVVGGGGHGEGPCFMHAQAPGFIRALDCD